MTTCSRPRAAERWPHGCGSRAASRRQRHGAPRHAAGARSTRAAGPGRPLRGGAAPGVPPTGRSVRDARERQPHPSGRRAGLGGVSQRGARVLRRRRSSPNRGRRHLPAERARTRGTRAGSRRNEQQTYRGAAVPEHPHGRAPPLERLREAPALRKSARAAAAARFSRQAKTPERRADHDPRLNPSPKAGTHGGIAQHSPRKRPLNHQMAQTRHAGQRAPECRIPPEAGVSVPAPDALAPYETEERLAAERSPSAA